MTDVGCLFQQRPKALLHSCTTLQLVCALVKEKGSKRRREKNKKSWERQRK